MRDIHDKKHNFIIAHAVYYAVRADFNSKKGHSAGIGATQDLLDGDASIGQIMVKVGWSKVDTVRRYVGVTSIAAMSSGTLQRLSPRHIADLQSNHDLMRSPPPLPSMVRKIYLK